MNRKKKKKKKNSVTTIKFKTGIIISDISEHFPTNILCGRLQNSYNRKKGTFHI